MLYCYFSICDQLEASMARRRELKNIASGLLCSFISRNNDVGGYWGIGKLCLLAQDRAITCVKLDLLSEVVLPESAEFSKLLQGYNSFLRRHLAARNISDCWVTSVIIGLDFSPKERPEKQVPIITWGNLFKLSVTILDDRSRKHTVSTYSYCAPHNSRKEHQSVGHRF
jgi:hypothetical protein